MEMRVYISNLGKSNVGERIGAWFDLPIDLEEVQEKIGLNLEDEEYAIQDYELPFEIRENIPIEELNALAEKNLGVRR